MKLSLSPDTERLIEEKISSGRYHSADEVVRESLKLLETRDEASPSEFPEEAEKTENASDLVTIFEGIAAEVPDAVWETLPRDLAQNHEHYLYGSSKQS